MIALAEQNMVAAAVLRMKKPNLGRDEGMTTRISGHNCKKQVFKCEMKLKRQTYFELKHINQPIRP